MVAIFITGSFELHVVDSQKVLSAHNDFAFNTMRSNSTMRSQLPLAASNY
jgi:hypothetical protein